MGWSCSRDAGATVDAWIAACVKSTGNQNTWKEGGGPSEFNQDVRFFFETSRVEHRDGAITGTVHRFVGENSCKAVGSFRIEPDGKVSRGRKWLKIAAQGTTLRFGADAQPGSGGLRV